MKRILTVILASAMLFSALPAAFAQSDGTAPTLDPLSPLSIDGETGYVRNIPGPITVSELLLHFADRDKLTVTDAEGNALSLTDTVGSDARVTRGDVSVMTVIPGDVDGDAKINVKDAMAIVKSVAGLETDMVAAAGDVTFDGKSNVKDAMAILKKFAGWDVDLRDHTVLDPLTAPAEDGSVTLVFDDIMNRVSADTTEINENYNYTVKMAKNEIETLQLFLIADEAKTGVSLEITDPVNASGETLEIERLYQYYYTITMFNQLYGADYSNTRDARFSDPLPELVNPFDLNADESKGFAVKIKTAPDTAAGLYKSSVELKDGEGNVIKCAEFWVYVWDFTLEEETDCVTAFGLGNPNLTDGEPEYYDREIVIQKYKKYYDYLLENRISAYAIPYDVTDPRADEYMSNPRVTSFCTWNDGYGGQYYNDDETLLQMYEKINTNEVWTDKAYLYPVDEPYGEEGRVKVIEECSRLNELLKDYEINSMIPLGGNYYHTELGCDLLEVVAQYTNILCPSSVAYKDYVPYSEMKKNPELYPPGYEINVWVNTAIVKKYGQYTERVKAYREAGYKIWDYICIGPEPPHLNFFQSYQGVCIRDVFWQQYMNDVDGLLYWTVNDWTGVTKNKTHGGDGLLIYWGNLFGQEMGPVTSIRLESVRDGIEDFQYLTQLEELTDRDDAMGFVDRIIQGQLTFTEDHNVMKTVRDELGFYLESLYSAG